MTTINIKERIPRVTINADPLRLFEKERNDFILVIIGLSSIALDLDDPISVNPELGSIVWHMHVISVFLE